METKTYKLSVKAHIKSVAIKVMLIEFILFLFFVVVAGDAYPAFALFNFVVVGVIIYHSLTAVSVVVRPDGITVRRGQSSRELKYETFYFDAASQDKLTLEDRRTSRTETISCAGFDKKDFSAMMVHIRKAQTGYFMRRNAAGEYKSGAAVENKTAPTVTRPTAEAVKEASREASMRNPYSKNYAGKKSETKPAATEIKADAAVITPVTVSFDKDIPKDYNELPEIGKVTGIPKKPEEKPAKPAERESFYKVEFRYPKREITERCERANVMTVLWTMLAAVAAFLVWYLVIGITTGGIFTAACIIALIAAAVTLCAVLRRLSRTRGIFAKLEITDTHLIIDNKRYRFTELSQKSITPPKQEFGMRRLAFTFDGKRVEYTLGATKPSADKRDIYSFPRYAELYNLLKVKGF